LGVDPEYQNHGYGRKLLSCLLDRCVSAGIDTMHAAVQPTNEVVGRLYRQAGFRTVYTEAEYFGPNQPRELLTLDLHHGRSAEPSSSQLSTRLGATEI
jgi:ribosomal-protein-alanine N-acetyltransferase